MSDGGARLDHYLLQYIVSEEVMTERGYGRGGGLEANYRDVEKTIKVPFDREATAQMHTISNLIGATDYKRIQVTAVNVCGSKHLVGEPSDISNNDSNFWLKVEGLEEKPYFFQTILAFLIQPSLHTDVLHAVSTIA